jgi:hypothetical protein
MFDANDTPVKQKNDHTSESQQSLPQCSRTASVTGELQSQVILQECKM